MIISTYAVPLGVGKHVWDVPVQNMSLIGLLGNFTGTFSILAAVWSKTSFALTLLRLMSGKMRVVLWVIIITMNIAMNLNAIFLWIRCTPAAKTWNPMMDGTCWAPEVYPTYGMFAAGEFARVLFFFLAADPYRLQATLHSWTLCSHSSRGGLCGTCR